MFCIYCGKPVGSGNKFCIHCGKLISTSFHMNPEVVAQDISSEPIPSMPPIPAEPAGACDGDEPLQDELQVDTATLPVEETPEPPVLQPPSGFSTGQKRALVGVGVFVLLAFIASTLFWGEDHQAQGNIQSVQTGYLGGYTDVTIEEMLQSNFEGMDIVWDDGVTTDGETLVQVTISFPNDNYSANTIFQFTFLDLASGTFNVSAISSPGVDASSTVEALTLLNTLYYSYYLSESGWNEDAFSPFLTLSPMAVCYGAVASYQGNRTNLYRRYLPDFPDVFVGELLGLSMVQGAGVEAFEPVPASPTPVAPKPTVSQDLANLLGGYVSVDYPDDTLDLELEPNCLHVRLMGYRLVLLDEYIDVPRENSFSLYTDDGELVQFTYYPEDDQILIGPANGPYSGWYYKTNSADAEDAIPSKGQIDLAQYEGPWSTMGTADNTYLELVLTTNGGANPVEYYIEYAPDWAGDEIVSMSGTGIIESNTLYFSGIDSNGNSISGDIVFGGRTGDQSHLATINSEQSMSNGPDYWGFPLEVSGFELGNRLSDKLIWP